MAATYSTSHEESTTILGDRALAEEEQDAARALAIVDVAGHVRVVVPNELGIVSLAYVVAPKVLGAGDVAQKVFHRAPVLAGGSC